MTTPQVERNVQHVADALANGELVIFLGAGANRCDRPEGWSWTKDQQNELPDGNELSQHLVNTCRVGVAPTELARVAQAVVLDLGPGRLKRELRKVFDADYRITRLHHLLAGLPVRLRAAGYPLTTDPLRRRLLLISTNYDDLLERAFVAAGQPFHTLRYQADPAAKGMFVYRAPDGAERLVSTRRKFTDIVADTHQFPVLMKFHGGLDRKDPARDSFVITEDDYIEYLAKTAALNHIPDPVRAMLKDSHVLFLGHALKDWNLRVMFHQLWADRNDRFHWWAVRVGPDDFDQKFWRFKLVDIIESPLREYVQLLDERLSAMGAAGAPA